LRRLSIARAMVAAPCADHLRFAPTHNAAFELQAKNCIAFAEARRMAHPVVRPADGQGDEKDLAATDFQAGHAHGSGHPTRGVLRRAISHMTKTMTKGILSRMTKPAAPVEQLAVQAAWGSALNFGPPIAKRLARKAPVAS